ncbi:MAG: endonuclease/exonuclease/phosphatase family protein [Pseudomonadota bacterium]|nr:endonuclease/exonuclease/phosphatase family protein [Pseudomonadota bacterium]
MFRILAPLLVIGTVLAATRASAWWVRAFDYPRLQLAALGLVALAAGWIAARTPFDRGLLLTTALCFGAQLLRVVPYTPLWPCQMVRARHPREGASVRLLVANVLDTNQDHAAFLAVVARADPDLVLAVETDAAWMAALAPLAEALPHRVLEPRENGYGIGLWSRLPLEEARVEYLVDPTVPSVHATILLPSGQRVAFHGLHPRPPVPAESTDTAGRDAELVVVGRATRNERYPSIVAGDLNDVAWSHTTRLFLRLSGMLDPRRGRGFFHTFNAKRRLVRFPLDHVFASSRFTLVELTRLPAGGSDHFPVLVELALEPDAPSRQERPAPARGDEAEAEAKTEAVGVSEKELEPLG